MLRFWMRQSDMQAGLDKIQQAAQAAAAPPVAGVGGWAAGTAASAGPQLSAAVALLPCALVRVLQGPGAGGPAPTELLSRAKPTIHAFKVVHFCLLCMRGKVSARRARRRGI